MIGIVIVAHGGLAREYLAAVEHVLGKQQGMRAISIGVQEDRGAKQQEISAAATAVDTGGGVVVVTDMFGGTPSNLAMSAMTRPDVEVIYGANLPLLVAAQSALLIARIWPVLRAAGGGLDPVDRDRQPHRGADDHPVDPHHEDAHRDLHGQVRPAHRGGGRALAGACAAVPGGLTGVPWGT